MLVLNKQVQIAKLKSALKHQFSKKNISDEKIFRKNVSDFIRQHIKIPAAEAQNLKSYYFRIYDIIDNVEELSACINEFIAEVLNARAKKLTKSLKI